jgi:hypothetical protein
MDRRSLPARASGLTPWGGFRKDRIMPLSENPSVTTQQIINLIDESWSNAEGWGREYEIEAEDREGFPRVVQVFAEGFAGLVENEVVIHSVEQHDRDVRNEFDLELIENIIWREVFGG